MATDEEAREAADGKEVQVEAMDLEPFHMQTHLDSKLSSMEIKNEAETIDSTEGKSKIPEDQVLVEAPSEIKLPLEHNLNGTSSSLNGQTEEEDKISDEQLHKDSKKDHEQVEAALDGESRDQNNKINKEANDCSSHGEITTEDNNLLNHENEEEPKRDDEPDEDPMLNALKTNSDSDQNKLVVHQLDHNMEPAKATENTQAASMENIPNAEVVTDAILDAVDGSTETDEAARENGAIHIEHRESFPEINSTAKHIDEVVKAECQQSKQADTIDADAVHEDIPKREETGVSEEMPKSEHADESTIDAQKVIHQEPSEDTNDSSYEKKEQKEMKNADAVNTEARGPTTSSQEVDESTEEIMDNVAENIVEVTNVASVDEVNKEKNMPVIESEAEEDSHQRHVSLLDDSAQEDNTEVSEEQHMAAVLEINEIEATRTEVVPEENNASVSEESSPEDYVQESETTSGTKAVNTTESLEAIEGDKDTKSREMPGQNSVDSARKSTKENNTPESEPTSEIQPVQEPESEETKVTELAQVNESSPEISATVFQKQIQENNPTTSELHVMESEGGVKNIEAAKVQATTYQLNSDHPEEKPTEETIISSEPQTLEPESVEKINEIEDTNPQDISQQTALSSSEKAAPEEVANEDITTIEPDDGHQQPQDPELDATETSKSQEIVSSNIVSNYEEPTSEDNVTVTKPNPETQPEDLLSAEVMEDTENVNGHGALDCEAAQKENVETEAIVEISPVQEPELEEAKNTEPVGTEDNTTPSDLPAEKMEKETMETEAIPYESPVAIIREVTENDILTAITPHDNIQPVLNEASVDDKCAETTEKPRETQQIAGSAQDEIVPVEDNMAMAEPTCEAPLPNVIAQGIKDTEDAQTDQFSNVESFPPGEADQESKLPRIEPTSDVQELGSTELTGGIEAMETEDHQQQRVSTLEEPAIDSNQVHMEKPEELKDNEAMEAEQVLEQNSINTPDNAPEERSELGNDTDCCVQPAQHVEPPRDNEDIKLLKEEEISDQKIIILEDTATEDIVEDEINPTVDMEQEHEQISVETSGVQEVRELGPTEQTRDIEATETEEHQHHRVSTLEDSEVDSKLKVDDNQVHEEILKDNEEMEPDQVLEQSNISTPNNAAEERSELGNDPDCCVQPAQRVESSRDSEDSKLLKEEETTDQKVVTLEDTAAEDIAVDEIDPPVGMEQEHEQKSTEEVKDISANEGKEDVHTSKPDASDELASESNTATTDPDYDIQSLNDFETKETKSIEGINDRDISCEKTETATLVEPSPTDNEIAPQEHPLESHKETLGNETENAILSHEMDDEIRTSDEQKLEPSLASSVQEISHTSPSKDHILVKVSCQDPIAVPYNAESGGHEDKECTNKVNDDLLVIPEPEKDMVAGMQKNKEMQNETEGVHHAESHTKVEEEEMSQLRSDEPYNEDTKIDDTTHNTTVQPRDIEEIEENKGLSSINKPDVETSELNNAEQDLSIHHKVQDEKLESTEDNAVELEALQEKINTSNVEPNNDDQLPISDSFTKHETDSADDVLQLETEGNTFDKANETVSYEQTQASSASATETVTSNEEICDKITGTEGELPDESLNTFDDARKHLDVSSLVTESNGERMNDEMEEHKFAAPAHSTMDENNSKQDISVSEKPLPTEPKEQEDGQTHKEQYEEDMHEPDFDDQKEVEQDLPVSNFLMNLILGKENSDANGHSEPEAETKQEETKDDNSSLIIPKQEESLVLPPTENSLEDKLAVEQEKKDVKCSEEKHEVVEEQSHDLKLGKETTLETDAELNLLESSPYQEKMQDEISNEILSEEAAEEITKMEAKDIALPNIKQDDRQVDTACQDSTEVATQNEIGSLKNDLDELNNTMSSEEETLGKGQTGLLPECLNDARSVNSVFEQTLPLTESGKTEAKRLPSEADSVPNPVCEIQDKIESLSIETVSTPDIQVECEEDKTEEKQPTTTATDEVPEEHMEISNDNMQKIIGTEATSNEQEPQIDEQVSDTKIVSGHEKEISQGSSSTLTDKKEDSNISVKEGNNIQTSVETQADCSNMQINQDKQEASDNRTEMESEKLDEYNIQAKQGNDDDKSPKECHEENQQLSIKKETADKGEDVNETVKSHTEIVNIKANEEQELPDSKVQERDLNVFSPKDVRKPEESFVDTAKPKFSTDEEQSPKFDDSNMSEQKTYEGKTKDEEKIENFTDEAMKTEAQVAGQKAARKKQNLLSGVGSKVKHQLAKVKKVITGKPGHTKPESPK